jgi:hypothetical protein
MAGLLLRGGALQNRRILVSSLLFDLGEGFACGDVDRRSSGRDGDAPDDQVAIARIELDAITAAAGLGCGD